MHLLVTRPEQDAARLAERLRAAGHRVSLQPLLTIRFRDVDAAGIDPAATQALLITSANGVRALSVRADLAALRAIPVIAVGPASAEAARAAGFGVVHQAGGDVAALAAKVTELCTPENGPLVHVSGQAVAGDLQGALEACGFQVERAVLYDAAAAEKFAPEVVETMAARGFDGVLFYSARTAAVFRTLAEGSGFDAVFDSATAFCLSEPVAAALDGLGFADVCVAARPTDEAMIALVGPAA